MSDSIADYLTNLREDDHRHLIDRDRSELPATVVPFLAEGLGRHALERLARLQEVTAALSEALSPTEVAAVVLSKGLVALGAVAGSVVVRTGEAEELQLLRAVGYSPEVLATFQHIPMGAPVPIAEAARTGEAIWLASDADRAARYPELVRGFPSNRNQAWAAVPLVVEGRTTGSLGLSFAEERAFDDSDRAFILTLAAQCAQALERARLYEAERQARSVAEAAKLQVTNILESITDAFFTVNRDWRLAYVNRRTVELARLLVPSASPAQFVGRNLWEVVPDLLGTGFETQFRDALARQVTVGFEEYFSPLDRWFSVHAYPSEDGLAVYMQDVTDRKRAEEAQRFLAAAGEVLNQSLDYEAILQGIARLVVPILADLCFVDLVESESWIHRLTVAIADPTKEQWASELIGRYPADPHMAGVVFEVLRSGQSLLIPEITEPIEVIFPLVGATGNSKHFEVLRQLAPRSLLVVPLVTRRRLLGTLMFVRSEAHRCYDDADLALAEELARRAALAVDNARLYREAQHALHARNVFLTSVTHDLRNPLTVIKGMAQLLQERVSRLSDRQAGRLIDLATRIDAASTRIDHQLSQLLDLAQHQLGQPLTLVRSTIDLGSLVRRVVAQQRETGKRHRIRVDATVSELIGEWDANRLERVVTNLIDNAIKYSPDGGDILVTIAREDKTGAAWAVLAVRDRGVGIPSAEIPNIFDPFYRASNVASQTSGTGVGLASVRQTVEEHGGTIVVESAEGAGTTFVVRLPLRHAESQE